MELMAVLEIRSLTRACPALCMISFARGVLIEDSSCSPVGVMLESRQRLRKVR